MSAEPAMIVPMRSADRVDAPARPPRAGSPRHADREPQRRAVEHPGQHRDEPQREIGRRVWLKSTGRGRGSPTAPGSPAGERARPWGARSPWARQAVDVVGKAGGEERDAEPGDMLRGPAAPSSARAGAQTCPAERRRREARPEIAAGIDREPADHRAEGHDPLDPEVQHAHPLAQKHAPACRE
jgi:hypothetical protein